MIQLCDYLKRRGQSKPIKTKQTKCTAACKRYQEVRNTMKPIDIYFTFRSRGHIYKMHRPAHTIHFINVAPCMPQCYGTLKYIEAILFYFMPLKMNRRVNFAPKVDMALFGFFNLKSDFKKTVSLKI